jgi:hypothetical protein
MTAENPGGMESYYPEGGFQNFPEGGAVAGQGLNYGSNAYNPTTGLYDNPSWGLDEYNFRTPPRR